MSTHPQRLEKISPRSLALAALAFGIVAAFTVAVATTGDWPALAQPSSALSARQPDAPAAPAASPAPAKAVPTHLLGDDPAWSAPPQVEVFHG
jgi:hypothetical protein